MAKLIASHMFLTIGLDVGDRVTHLCALDPDRQVVERGKFRTTREAIVRRFSKAAKCLVVLEAGSQSMWMSHLLVELGHKVMVVDPRRVHKLISGNRKTDRRDAESLARLAIGAPELMGEAHHRSFEDQADLSIIRSRAVLVESRTKLVNHVRGTLKTFGIHKSKCSAKSFHRTVVDAIPETLLPALEPVLATLDALERSIKDCDQRLELLAKERRPETEILRQVTGVGPLVAMTYALTVGDPKRFRRSRDVGPWAGLVPDRQSSGDKDPQLPLRRCGDTFLRKMLVIASHHILGPFGKDSDLRRYGLRICERGGANAKKRAVVAVARKLAILLHRLWVDNATYEPLHNSKSAEAA